MTLFFVFIADHRESHNTCRDKSHLIYKSNETEECRAREKRGEVFVCKTNPSQCIDNELKCDGYLQCEDGSDEGSELCEACSFESGYIYNKEQGKLSSATFSCPHLYTGKNICAIPCDMQDGMCLDHLDEANCNNDLSYDKMIWLILDVVAAVFLIHVLLIRLCPVPITIRNSSDDIELEHLTEPSMHQKAIDLIQAGQLEELAKIGAKCIHEPTFQPLKPYLFNLINTMSQDDSEALYAGIYNELMFDKNQDKLEIDRLVKEALGTTEQTKNFYDPVDKGCWFRFTHWEPVSCMFKAIELCYNQKYIYPIFNSLRACIKCWLYYLDLLKDILTVYKLFQLVNAENHGFSGPGFGT